MGLKILMTIVILGMLLLFFIFVIYPKYISGGDAFGAYLENGDFDGDGKTNPLDPCQCGYDNDKIIGASGGEYCVASFDQKTCGCANNKANIAANIAMKDNIKKEMFIWSQSAVGPGRCLYTGPDCRYLMKSDLNFFGEIDAHPGQTPCDLVQNIPPAAADKTKTTGP